MIILKIESKRIEAFKHDATEKVLNNSGTHNITNDMRKLKHKQKFETNLSIKLIN